MEIAGRIVDFLSYAFMAAVFLAVLYTALQNSRDQSRQDQIVFGGVEVEAEILGRFEAGVEQGSKPRARQWYIASWDPRELELRYIFDGREFVSRGRVPLETFFRTRRMKTLRIKVSREHPEQWAALV